MRLILFMLLLTSCKPVKYGYAKARFTSANGKFRIEVLEPFKPFPDTTVIVNVIRKIK